MIQKNLQHLMMYGVRERFSRVVFSKPPFIVKSKVLHYILRSYCEMGSVHICLDHMAALRMGSEPAEDPNKVLACENQ